MDRDGGRKKVGRKATYDSGLRFARFVYELGQRVHGWSFEDIEGELGISRRTLQRYLEACRTELVDDEGRPLFETVRSGDKSIVRLARPDRPPSRTVWELLSLFFGLRLAHVLDQTLLADLNADLLEKLRAGVSKQDAARMQHLDRKLYALPSMPRDYSERDDVVDAVLRALIDQHRVCIEYRGVVGEGRTHEFDPYSLVEHRGGLYLLGKSHLDDRILWLAIERIDAVSPVRDDGGRFVTFAYPSTFDPARHTDGMFGVFDGERQTVVLALQNAATESYLQARRLHPTQRFFRGPDGRMHLEMKVRGTHELLNWLMSTSPWVEVLSPPSLREELAARLRTSAAAYATARPPARAERASAGRREGKPARKTDSA